MATAPANAASAARTSPERRPRGRSRGPRGPRHRRPGRAAWPRPCRARRPGSAGRTRVRDAQHLEHGRHAGLAAAADPFALGDVPDEVGRVGEHLREESRPSPSRTTSWPSPRRTSARASIVSGLSNSSNRSSGPSDDWPGRPARGRTRCRSSRRDPSLWRSRCRCRCRCRFHCRLHIHSRCHCRCRSVPRSGRAPGGGPAGGSLGDEHLGLAFEQALTPWVSTGRAAAGARRWDDNGRSSLHSCGGRPSRSRPRAGSSA